MDRLAIPKGAPRTPLDHVADHVLEARRVAAQLPDPRLLGALDLVLARILESGELYPDRLASTASGLPGGAVRPAPHGLRRRQDAGTRLRSRQKANMDGVSKVSP